MCTRYISPEARDIEAHWHVGRDDAWRAGEMYPRARGPFIRAAGAGAAARRELVIGQWGLIPWFAKSAQLRFSTVNARFEEITKTASYRDPWRKGQRCIIPAWSFDEPNWESGKNQWWRFRRADGAPWGLAGLWNAWTDKATGEIVESYTMLTLNADQHALFRRMHKPDPALPADQQDKRSVVPVAAADVDAWLLAPVPLATALVRLTPAEAFDAGPAAMPGP